MKKISERCGLLGQMTEEKATIKFGYIRQPEVYSDTSGAAQQGQWRPSKDIGKPDTELYLLPFQDTGEGAMICEHHSLSGVDDQGFVPGSTNSGCKFLP